MQSHNTSVYKLSSVEKYNTSIKKVVMSVLINPESNNYIGGMGEYVSTFIF